jgi:hypothetical protein
VSLLIDDEFLDKMARGPVRKMMRQSQVLPVGGKDGRLDHLVESGEGCLCVSRPDGFLENLAESIPDAIALAEAAKLTPALAKKAGMPGGFPGVLAQEIFQVDVPDPVDKGRHGPEEFALRLEKHPLKGSHLLDSSHAAGRRSRVGSSFLGRGYRHDQISSNFRI